MTGDGRDEVGYCFCFATLIELCGHLAKAPGASFGNRVQHEFPAAGFRRDLASETNVEVRPNHAVGFGRLERVADRARL